MISAAVLLYSELTAAQTVTAAMAVRWCAVKRVTAGRQATDSTRNSPAQSCGKHCNADYCETKLVLRVREQRTVSIWNRPLCWKHSSVIFISANAFCVKWLNMVLIFDFCFLFFVFWFLIFDFHLSQRLLCQMIEYGLTLLGAGFW